MNDTTADVIVVGLGAVGSAVTYQLALGGARVIGIDRFAPPHSFGSSHGSTRITRLAIGEGDAYVPLVRRSNDIWRSLEAESGEILYQRTGGLVMGPRDGRVRHHGKTDFVRRTIDAAVHHGISHEVLDADEVARRFPAFLVRGDELAYYERDAGVLFPEACVRTQLEAATRCGARIHVDEQVLGVESSGQGARVRTSDGTYGAAAVVVAAGAWLPQLLGGVYEARLRVLRQVLFWFETREPALYAPGALPVFIWMHGTGDEDYMYGFPKIDGFDGVKVASEQYGTTTDPAAVERSVPLSESQAMFERNVKGRLRSMTPNLVHASVCLYTVSPDSGFIVDRLAEHDGIWVVSACSGHGFKHSSAIGEAIAKQVLGFPGNDLSVFSSRRFSERPMV